MSVERLALAALVERCLRILDPDDPRQGRRLVLARADATAGEAEGRAHPVEPAPFLEQSTALRSIARGIE